MKLYIIISTISLCINILYAQSSVITTRTTTTTPTTTIPNIPCQSKYTPFFNGTCLPPSNCIGATLSGICSNKNYVCCISDPEMNIGNTNNIITLSSFQALAGNTQRTRTFYGLFAKALSDAGINTCHQASAFFAQLQGETENFTMFEETNVDTSKLDFDASLGNNATGDGAKYRGRGALFLRGRGNYGNATLNIAGIKYNLLQEPERVAFPSVAFKIASWTWTKNSYLITQNSPAVKGNLNQLADGTFHNFTLLTHAISTNVQHLKERAIIYEESVKYLKSIGKDCKLIKRGSGVTCEIGFHIGKAVPLCIFGYNRPFCGCGGDSQKDSCPYGYNSAMQCRSSSIIKCCYEKCDTYLDLVFVLDSSGSIGAPDFIKERKFVATLVNDLDIGPNATRVAIINFGTQVDVITRLDTFLNKTQLIHVIDTIPYLAQNTNTQGALQAANDIILNEANGMRPIADGIPKVVVVITDGASNVNPQYTIPNANKIKSRGISVVSVGVGPSLNQAELEGIASNPDDVYNVANYDKILEIIEGLSKTACEQPAKAVVEQVIESRVQKNFYKYFKLEIKQSENETLDSFSVELKNLLGTSRLFYSFDEENPKDPNDFVADKPSNGGAYIEKNMKVEGRSSIYQISRPENKTVLFMSVKGFAEENEFQIFVYNRTIPINSQQTVRFNFAIITLLLTVIGFINSYLN